MIKDICGFMKFVEDINNAKDRLIALENLKDKVLMAKRDLIKLYETNEMPRSIKELLEEFDDYMRKIEGFDDSE